MLKSEIVILQSDNTSYRIELFNKSFENYNIFLLRNRENWSKNLVLGKLG